MDVAVKFVISYPNFLPLSLAGASFLFIFSCLVVIVLLVGTFNQFFSAYKFIFNKGRPSVIQINYVLWGQLVGIPAVLTLAFAAHNWAVYLLAVAVLSFYIVPDTKFIMTLVAIIRGSKEYLYAIQDTKGQKNSEITPSPSTSRNSSEIFEELYGWIFGSQLRILKKMATIAEGTISSSLAEIEYKRTLLPTIYPYNQYIDFLARNGLISLLPEDQYKITELGKKFLKYIEDKGYALDKDN